MFLRQSMRAYRRAAVLEDTKFYADLENEESPLRQMSAELSFPLSEEDKAICTLLRQKLADNADSVGFAAPQLGFNKRIIAVSITEDMVACSEGGVSYFPLTVLINPQLYPRRRSGMEADWEVCFSDRYYTALVSRYRTLTFKAYDEEGKLIRGDATDLLARVLQHETDHLDGIMSKDKAIGYLSLKEVFDIDKLGKDEDYIETPRVIYSPR